MTQPSKEFDIARTHEQKSNIPDRAKVNRRETLVNCKYCTT